MATGQEILSKSSKIAQLRPAVTMATVFIFVKTNYFLTI
jgi:hypothetical protein